MLWSQNQAYTPEEMIKKHLKPRGIKNKLVLKAMRQVPRHVFVPEKFKAIAYYDRALPIDKGQTISQPYIVALMIQTLNPKKKPPYSGNRDRFWLRSCRPISYCQTGLYSGKNRTAGQPGPGII